LCDYFEVALGLDLNTEVFEPSDRSLDCSTQFLELTISLLIIGGAFELDEGGSVFVLTVVGEHYSDNMILLVVWEGRRYKIKLRLRTS
jgi:hypothetical protein